MNFSTEVLLVAGVIGFYVIDSALLLYSNEFVLLENNGRWNFVYPNSNWRMLGRVLYIPNPLKPETARFRSFWSANEKKPEPDATDFPASLLGSLAWLRYLTTVLFFQLIVFLPVALLALNSDFVFLLLVATIYLNIVLLLAVAYSRREALGISARRFAILAVDGILCAPLALNLIGKITLHRLDSIDPISFAQGTFDKSVFEQLVDAVCAKVDEQIDYAETGGERYHALQSFRERLLNMKR